MLIMCVCVSVYLLKYLSVEKALHRFQNSSWTHDTSRPFQFVAMELVEDEAPEGFPYVSSHDLSDSSFFRQKTNQLSIVI